MKASFAKKRHMIFLIRSHSSLGWRLDDRWLERAKAVRRKGPHMTQFYKTTTTHTYVYHCHAMPSSDYKVVRKGPRMTQIHKAKHNLLLPGYHAIFRPQY